MKIGTIESIWRYPVKGMAGESLGACALDSQGLAGDRTWAVQDVKRQEIQSCKFRPQLLQCRARTRGELDSEHIEITFPDGQTLRSDHPQVNAQVSALIGHESVLQPLRADAGDDFYRRYKTDDHTWLDELKATFAREEGEPLPDLDNLPKSMQEFVSVRGTFFLVSPFHILTTASLDYMKQQNPEADWHLERFRPNLMIETLPGIEGLAEQDWIGKTLQIGELRIECDGPAPRCGAVTRQQSDFGADTGLLRSIVRHADQNLGIYGNVRNSGLISVGDEVVLI
ncbi:MOSC domain-containing protein [Marinobacter sp. 2_MG-2023]|uniref:MOSC domain-containing protein n=1 Tax=Marinobacter sp. 2_MG-2023 TaxID=3062679 RepID=UPI0026E21925|nr:MOSC N-terminal beta barrel domain-containing protein [Marinobacter sp. 2_MG-2023]MDO6442893.1 MOSC N-terminal beta barrel domain-containing protein [Marinobacter sp. 2_MG-2023]